MEGNNNSDNGKLTVEKWEDGTYGVLPFKNLKKVIFKVSNIDGRNFSGHIQYNLLNLVPVVKVYVNLGLKTVSIIYSGDDISKDKLADYIQKGFKSWDLKTKHEVLETVEESDVDYKELVGFHYNL